MISCRGKDTCDEKNLLQEQANLPSFYRDAVEDAQISYHRHTGN